MHMQEKTPGAGRPSGAKANRQHHPTVKIGKRYGLAAILHEIAELNLEPRRYTSGKGENERTERASVANQKLVLFAMAALGDYSTGVCEASIERIAKSVGWSGTRPVRNAIAALVEADALTVLRQSDGGRGMVSRWRINTLKMHKVNSENPVACDSVSLGRESENPVACDRDTQSENPVALRAKPCRVAPKTLSRATGAHDSRIMRGTEPAKSADSDPLEAIRPRPELQALGRASGRGVAR